MTSPSFIRLEKRFWSNETPIGFLFDFGALIGFLISGIYIYQVLFQIVDENLAEYAVLKSMGYPNSFFTVLVVCTATILALAAIPPAVAVSFVVYEICVAATLLDLELTIARVLGGRRADDPHCDLISMVCQASIASHRSSSLDVGSDGIRDDPRTREWTVLPVWPHEPDVLRDISLTIRAGRDCGADRPLGFGQNDAAVAAGHDAAGGTGSHPPV